MTLDLEAHATTNWWDAPLTIREAPDGSVRVARTLNPFPEPLAHGEVEWAFPHAVITVDGEMGRFDADRQPQGGSHVVVLMSLLPLPPGSLEELLASPDEHPAAVQGWLHLIGEGGQDG